jgi:hypothetical protein
MCGAIPPDHPTMRSSLLRLFLGAAASVALLAGCGGGDVSPNSGEVRLVNATDEFGALDLYEGSDRLTPASRRSPQATTKTRTRATTPSACAEGRGRDDRIASMPPWPRTPTTRSSPTPMAARRR